MSQKSKSGRLVLPTPEEDAAIMAAAMSDPDSIPMTDEEWARAQPAPNRPRGRPHVPVPRKNITLRLSQDVVDRFRASGKGWHTRINDALEDWLRDHSPSP
jgi:uncharacterized protein (DUF4415 family)